MDLQGDGMTLRIQLSGGRLVEGEGSIDEIALMLAQPLRAIEGAARFLAAGEGQLQSPQRAEVLVAIAHEGVYPDGGLGFVVERSTRVEVAVLLTELEW